MFDRLQKFFRLHSNNDSPLPSPAEEAATLQIAQPQVVKIEANDPLRAYLMRHRGVVEINELDLSGSPALRDLKEAGVEISVPLINQGKLIGLLNLGPRMSDQQYSSADFRLLNALSIQASPVLRVAQLARRRLEEARERERMDSELRVARTVQQTLLPEQVPHLPGWSITPFWQPAQAVSGDFYDFIQRPDGRLALLVADVTGKGMPAALVMADTRRTLRILTERFASPGAVLQAANEQLFPDVPSNMFATCLYLVLDPLSGHAQLANAGHNLPFLRKPGGEIHELTARGMPLGLLPGMGYEEIEFTIHPGEQLFLYSDGVTEAHNPQGEMFDTPRLRRQLADGCQPEEILRSLHVFTGDGWQQEDDITMLVLRREPDGEALDSS